jgi:hypothetical protein
MVWVVRVVRVVTMWVVTMWVMAMASAAAASTAIVGELSPFAATTIADQRGMPVDCELRIRRRT